VAIAEKTPRPGAIPLPLWVGVVMMIGAWFLAQALIPRHYLADDLPPLVLKEAIPHSIGNWREEENMPQVVADPTVEQTINQFYSQSVSRTYVDAQGNRVMLTVAYGKDQNSNSTAAHRPEFCYAAQGFLVEKRPQETLEVGSKTIPVARLVGRLAERTEPITYWVTLADTPSLPGLPRKIQQLKYGLRGEIADGFLVRVSTLGSDPQQEYAVHDRFLRDWRNATPDAMKKRFFGS
jgi:EpsI family protein